MTSDAHQFLSRRRLHAVRQRYAEAPAATRWQAGLRCLKTGAAGGAYVVGNIGAPATTLVDGLVGTGRWGLRIEDHGVIALAGAVVSGIGGVVVGGALGTVGGAGLGLLRYGLRPKRMIDGWFVVAALGVGASLGAVLGSGLALALFVVALQLLRAVSLLLKATGSTLGAAPGLLLALPWAGAAIVNFDPADEVKLAQTRAQREQAAATSQDNESELSEAWAGLHQLLVQFPPALQRTWRALVDYVLEGLGVLEPASGARPAAPSRPPEPGVHGGPPGQAPRPEGAKIVVPARALPLDG